jgi:hypothetical protein
MSSFTCAVVAPFLTSTIRPLSLLRALIVIADLLGGDARRDAVACRRPPSIR